MRIRIRHLHATTFLLVLGLPALLALPLVAVRETQIAPGRDTGDAPRSSRHLLIVVDGLRPDYVTAELMPHLTALAARGVRFTRHHAVYPTVTRVNASSFSTGAYPERHGLLGNTVYMPDVEATRFLDTGERAELGRIVSSGKPLLTAETMGEVLQRAGKTMLVVSSGSSGSALLNNHTVSGGAILHREFTLPEELGAAVRALDSMPSSDAPRPALDQHAVDMFLDVGLPRVQPAVTVLWLGALDATAHAHGIGTPQTREVLRQVDAQIARVQDGLAGRGLLDDYTIWVSSDHGFSTHTGAPDVAAALAPFAGLRADGTPRIVSSGGAIYVRDDRSDKVVAEIVRALQRTRGVGAIFTPAAKPGGLDGVVPGTLSFDAVRWQHPRAAQIFYSVDWTDVANEHGVPGSTASGGTAGHGSASPWDIHNTLIVAGAGVRRGAVMDGPSGNVDLAPSLLALLGMMPPASVQGRVLREAFAGGAETGAGVVPTVETTEHTARTVDGAYVVTATFSTVQVGGERYRYFDRATVQRR